MPIEFGLSTLSRGALVSREAYLEVAQAAERAGFGFLSVNDHIIVPANLGSAYPYTQGGAWAAAEHGHCFDQLATLAFLAGCTSRLRLLSSVMVVPHRPAVSTAKMLATIDVLSKGRLILGVGAGWMKEEFGLLGAPFEDRGAATDEYIEAYKALWTEQRPAYSGKHVQFADVIFEPKPIQKPHPPIWIPGAGSYETMDFVAKRRWAYMGIPYFHRRVFKKNFDYFREACAREGYTASPDQMGWLVPVYVAETDARARAEFEPHLWYFAKKLLPGINIAPPGYTSARSALKMLGSFGDFLLNVGSWDEVVAGAYAIVGSPATVRAQMAELARELGVGNVLTLLQLGTLPTDLTRRNMELFATEVMPALRRDLAGPVERAAVAAPLA